MIITNDGGQIWNASELKSPLGENPVVISNSKGNLFYFHLTDPSGEGKSDEGTLDRIICQTSIDEGATWSEGTSVGNNTTPDQNRLWPAVHPKKNEVFVTWTQFDKYTDTDPSCQSNIMFSKSGNGNRFSRAVRVNETSGGCGNDDNTVKGAMAAIGADGKIYVTWANQGNIYLDRSYDNGSTWLSNDLLIAKQEGRNLSIPGIEKCNGLPILAIDNSLSRYQGTLYLLWADQKNGADDTDIWLMKSRSRGDMWSKPMRINKDEAGSHQFLPWMAIDETNGNVYIVYYDRRNYDDLQTDVYLAYSFDGGSNFNEAKISETPFTPDSSKPIGDHIGIDAHAGLIIPTWTRMDNGRTSVWTSLIKESELPKAALKK